jgi:large subunit ribosomal protein L1
LNCIKSCKKTAANALSRRRRTGKPHKNLQSRAAAVSTWKKFQPAKFDQTVAVSFRLGVDAKQSDQMVRGTCPVPHGSGKQVRVLVFREIGDR